MVHSLLEGATAYVGFDVQKESIENYFLCDGTADDVQIALALAYVNGLGGGSVFLEEGDYDVTAGLSVPVDVMLRGAGLNTVLLYDAGGNCITITGNNVKIRDLKIDIVAGAGTGGTRPNCIIADTRANLEITKVWLLGDETVGDDGSNLRQCGIVFDTVTFSRISLCRSDDHMRNGIYIATSSNNIISENTCNGNTQQGIYVYSSSDDNVVVGNNFSVNGRAGINLFQSSNNTITGNTSIGNLREGIAVDSGIDNTISGNTCNENGRSGIGLSANSDNNTITGNTSSENTRHGIFLSGSDGNVVVGNSCNENDAGDATTYDGISLATSDGNLIGMNVAKLNDRWGIMVDDESDNNKISNNYTDGNDSGSIRIQNANCDKNQIEFNTVEEGAPSNAGTATRSYGNYDPSADAFVGDVGAAPF